MRPTRKPYLMMLVTGIVALLLSTWGTGVALAQDHDMEHDMEHDVDEDVDHDEGDSEDEGGSEESECSALAELFGLCTPAGGAEESECSFLAALFGRCDTSGTEKDCDSMSLLEWLFNHQCHGH